MGDDSARALYELALTHESNQEWSAALDRLEAAARSEDVALRAKIGDAAGRLAKKALLSSLRWRAERLARKLAGSASERLRAQKAQDEVLPAEVEAAREVLARPEIVRALRDALGRARGADGALSLPVEAVLSRLLACDLDLSATLELALDLVLEATGAARGFILVRDAKGRLEVTLGRGLERAQVAPALSTGVLAEAERTGEPVFLDDASEDPGFRERASVLNLGLRSVACAPIVDERAARRDVIGLVYLDDPRMRERFGEGARAVLTTLARAIAPPLRNARRFEAQRAAIARSRAPAHAVSTPIVGASKPVRELVALLARVAPEEVPVLLEGESGTGKELCARTVHELSRRRDGPFVVENLGALPATLVEAELFGVKKGAFTGADRDRDGLFVRARGGTLFLDEIGELPLESQAKLLRAVQELVVRPVGGDAPIPVDVRIVAATNRDLGAQVREGKFREDLLYRLRVVAVRVPPLRERLEDVPLLCEHLLERIAERRGEPVVPLSQDALARLARREWRGNIRELENVLWRVALGGEAVLEDLDEPVADVASPGEGKLDLSIAIPGEPAPLDEARLAFDRAYVTMVLGRCGGNVAKAARVLGITRPALWRCLKRLGIERP